MERIIKADPAAKPEVTAAALAKAAIQTAQRAVFTAQLAAEAMARAEGRLPEGWLLARDAGAMTALRDGLLDALGAMTEEVRGRLSACRASITADELIDLLSLTVQG